MLHLIPFLKRSRSLAHSERPDLHHLPALSNWLPFAISLAWKELSESASCIRYVSWTALHLRFFYLTGGSRNSFIAPQRPFQNVLGSLSSSSYGFRRKNFPDLDYDIAYHWHLPFTSTPTPSSRTGLGTEKGILTVGTLGWDWLFQLASRDSQ